VPSKRTVWIYQAYVSDGVAGYRRCDLTFRPAYKWGVDEVDSWRHASDAVKAAGGAVYYDASKSLCVTWQANTGERCGFGETYDATGWYGPHLVRSELDQRCARGFMRLAKALRHNATPEDAIRALRAVPVEYFDGVYVPVEAPDMTSPLEARCE